MKEKAYEKKTKSGLIRRVQVRMKKVDWVGYTPVGNIDIDGFTSNGEHIKETIFQKRNGKRNPNFKKIQSLLEPIGTYEYVDQRGKHTATKYDPKPVEGIWLRGNAFYGNDPLHFDNEPTVFIPEKSKRNE